MGCSGSKEGGLSHVDDSVHVMLSHDKKMAKKKGQPAPTGYVPRAEHPLLQKKPIVAAEEGDEAADETPKAE